MHPPSAATTGPAGPAPPGAEDPPPAPALPAAGRPRRAARLRRGLPHLPFVVVLTLGVVLRAVAVAALRPALFYYGDSYSYVNAAALGHPLAYRPFGYSWLLLALGPPHYQRVVIVQHLFGLVTSVLLYLLCLRAGLRPWVGALAAVPNLLTPITIRTEHFIMAEAMFTVLIALCVVLVWRRQPFRIWHALLCGALVTLVMLTRTVGMVTAVVVIGYLVLARVGWSRVAVTVVTSLVLVGAYIDWNHEYNYSWALTQYSHLFTYGRVAPFARCSAIEPKARVICPREPFSRRHSPNWYVWERTSPIRNGTVRLSQVQPLTGIFVRDVALHQPFTWAWVSTRDFAHYFVWPMRPTGQQGRLDTWLFSNTHSDKVPIASPRHSDGFFNVAHVARGWNRWLLHWQRVFPYPMPLLGLGTLAGLVAVALRRRRGPLESLFGLTAAVGLTLLAFPSVTLGFEYRFVVPAMPFLGVAAAAGYTLAARAYRQRRARPQPAGSAG